MRRMYSSKPYSPARAVQGTPVRSDRQTGEIFHVPWNRTGCHCMLKRKPSTTISGKQQWNVRTVPCTLPAGAHAVRPARNFESGEISRQSIAGARRGEAGVYPVAEAGSGATPRSQQRNARLRQVMAQNGEPNAREYILRVT